MDSSEASIYSDRGPQEEAARLLLSSGFRPSHAIGRVVHIASPLGPGRTLGSVWRAMRSLMEREPELAGQQRKTSVPPAHGRAASDLDIRRFGVPRRRVGR